MNYTFVKDLGDGEKKVFGFSFAGQDGAYISASNIVVTVDGKSVPYTVPFNDPNKVHFTTAPAKGAEVLIRRIMPKDIPYADFGRGNPFSQDALNNTARQQLYVTQEILDGFYPEGFYIKQDIDMGGHKFINMGKGEKSGDSVNYDQLQEQVEWNKEQDNRLASIEQGLVSNVGIRTVPYGYVAKGGEDTVKPPYDFVSALVYINGIFQNQTLGAYEIVDSTIMLAEPLIKGDEVYMLIGSGVAVPDDYATQEEVQAAYANSLKYIDSSIDSLRLEVFSNVNDVRRWGEGEAGFNAAMTELSESGGGTLVVYDDITFTSLPIQHKPKVTVIWQGRAIVKTGLTADYAYIMDGGADTPSYDNTDHFTLANKTNCYNLRLEAEDYKVGINAIGVRVQHCYGYTYLGGAVIGFNKGGFVDELCYEGKVSKITMVVSDARDPQSVGFESKCTDSWYSEISPVGYAYGGKMNKSGNSLSRFHPWGNTIDNLVGVMGKMHVGLWVTQNAGFSSYNDLILDTPVRRNTGSVPSRSNGGVGLINDAWDASFDKVLVLCSKNDAVKKSTLPLITNAKRCSYKDLSVSNPEFATDIWVSFEDNSGYLYNEFSGYGYAQNMRTGMTVGANSGVIFPAVTGVTVTDSNLSSGIHLNTLSFSVTATIATATSTADVELAVSPMYGVSSGSGYCTGGAWDAFSLATANSSKQLLQVIPTITEANKIKFTLVFIDGSQRFARYSDITTTSKRITLAGSITVK